MNHIGRWPIHVKWEDQTLCTLLWWTLVGKSTQPLCNMIISQDPRLPLELNCPKMWTCAVLLSLSEQGTVQECPPPLKLKLVGVHAFMHWIITNQSHEQCCCLCMQNVPLSAQTAPLLPALELTQSHQLSLVQLHQLLLKLNKEITSQQLVLVML